MLALLQKRKARAALVQACSMPHEAFGIEDEPVVQGLAAKSWEEISHGLKLDLERVRTLAGSQEREPYKIMLIEKYQPVAEWLLATRTDLGGLELLWWWYQWHVDVGQLDVVHDALRAAVAKGLTTPDKWSSNAETAFCDIVFKYSHDAHSKERPFEPRYLLEAVRDVEAGELAINAALKVKIYRMAGDLAEAAGDKVQALDWFEKVMAIDSRGGRKNKVKELKEELGREND